MHGERAGGGGARGTAHTPRGWLATPAWCLFDWASSPYPTVVITFVIAVYFERAIVGDGVAATKLWSWAISLSALAVALVAPVVGAAADAGGRRKPWLACATMLAVATCAGLWFAAPGPASIWLVLILVAVGNFGFELAMVLYNAMLPDLAGRGRIGRLSGWAWGVGYAGGLLCLALALVGLVRADPPPFGLAAATAEPVRAVALLVALWWLAFGWPLFAFTPDRTGRGQPFGQTFVSGLTRLGATIRHVRAHRNLARFLVARLIYIDGLNSLFVFGGLYAAGSFAMAMDEVLEFGIALNVTAGLGAFAFAWIDDRLGGKRTVILALSALIGLAVAILLVEDKLWFWILGLLIGLFIGPVQSASRSLMGRLAPAGRRTEMFGFYAFSGKATAFVGPWLVGLVTALADSQRLGMATIPVFFAVGLVLLLPVKEPRSP